MTNKELRDSEKLYIFDEELMEEHKRARKLVQRLNAVDCCDFEQIMEIVHELLGKSDNAFINPPFYCDFGYNIEVGQNFYANYNCTILDVAKVKIGDNCKMAPNVSIYTSGHPIHADIRNTGYEYGIGITIGDNVWIGGNSVICPGVNIGDNVVIGAGSVVTQNIPAGTVAFGNPCKVIRNITEEDRKYYFKKREIDKITQKHIDEILKR